MVVYIKDFSAGYKEVLMNKCVNITICHIHGEVLMSLVGSKIHDKFMRVWTEQNVRN